VGLAPGLTLEPLRAALLAQARAEAKQARAAAATARHKRLADAREIARALIEQGALEGARRAEEEALRRRASARRGARELRLHAQRTLVEELGQEARREALALRTAPRYGELLERLSRLARAQLGAQAELTLDPPGRGGLLARAGSASVDYTLAALVDRVLDEIDGRVEELWR